VETVGICSSSFDFLANTTFPGDRKRKSVPETIIEGRNELLGLKIFCLYPYKKRGLG
jgi:hypothetical protein